VEETSPGNALDELQAGAVTKGLVPDRVPRDCDGPPCRGVFLDLAENVRDLVRVDFRPFPGIEPLAPVEEAVVVVILKDRPGAGDEVTGILLHEPPGETRGRAHHGGCIRLFDPDGDLL